MRTVVHDRTPGSESRSRIVFNVSVSAITVVLTIFTSYKMVGFLSFQNMELVIDKSLSDLPPKRHPSVGLGLIVNVILISSFILQHSLMLRDGFAHYLKLKFHVLERSIYNIATCLTLQALMSNWYPNTCCFLWKINTHENVLLWWFFTLTHLCAWISVYGGCLIMDLGELLGIKQVYFDICKSRKPIFYKSDKFCVLYKHFRHPGFLSFVILLWCHPYMSLDRFVLALLLTAYIIWGFHPDHSDYRYLKKQLNVKISKLT